MTIETAINLFLFLLMTLVAIAIVRQLHLFAVVMLSGLFSLLSALLFVTLDAVDVAFTEAAVGAGITTVLMLGTIALTSRHETPPKRKNYLALFVTVGTGMALFYGTLDMPSFGSANAPVHLHVLPEYIARIPHEIGIPNMVTAILASYRSFDTMGETVVVFTAGIGVVLLISGLGKRNSNSSDNSSNNATNDTTDKIGDV